MDQTAAPPLGMVRAECEARTAGGARNIPVLLMTGNTEAITSEAMERAGVSGVLLKPFVRNELLEEIEKILNHQPDRLGPE